MREPVKSRVLESFSTVTGQAKRLDIADTVELVTREIVSSTIGEKNKDSTFDFNVVSSFLITVLQIITGFIASEPFLLSQEVSF